MHLVGLRQSARYRGAVWQTVRVDSTEQGKCAELCGVNPRPNGLYLRVIGLERAVSWQRLRDLAEGSRWPHRPQRKHISEAAVLADQLRH